MLCLSAPVLCRDHPLTIAYPGKACIGISYINMFSLSNSVAVVM